MNNIKVYEITPNSFCYGVNRAIKIVYDYINNVNAIKPIYMLGDIVHNKHVVSYFKNYVTIINYEDLETIKSGTVIITAHGASKEVINKITNSGLAICDATCPNVLHIQKQIINFIEKGYKVKVIGNKNHPEVLSYLGISKNVSILEDGDVLSNKTFITTQTTLVNDYVTNKLKAVKIDPQLDIIFDKQICNATKERQNALINSLDRYDMFLVVGDKKSNNCNSLLKIILDNNKRGFLVESCEDLHAIDFSNVKSIGITAGASTPHKILEEIIAKITY